MADVKAKVKTLKKKASKREKKGLDCRIYPELHPLPWVCWCFISGRLSRMSGSVLMM